jgi:hypothetical protein
MLILHSNPAIGPSLIECPDKVGMYRDHEGRQLLIVNCDTVHSIIVNCSIVNSKKVSSFLTLA